MRITKKFLALTRQTYPHGKERGLIHHLPEGYQEDGMGNYYIQIGETSTMFTCHLDTADRVQTSVKHVFDGNIIKTDGSSILGADDKAGMTAILYMIKKKVPGLYYFFIGEEVGCVGSKRLANAWNKTEFSKYIKKVVSFDRRGTDSIITYQMFGRCCSDEFAKELANRMNATGNHMRMRLDDTGILTDSAKFVKLVPECTNISVGYQNEHTGRECQDIDFLRRLCITISNVDWETLPISRNPLEEEEAEFCYGGLYGDDEYENSEWLEENYTHVLLDGKTKKVYVATSRIIDEKAAIAEWVATRQEYIGTRDIVWNGHSLYVESKSGHLDFVGVRTDIMEMVEELKSIPKSKISETIPGKKKTFMNVF